METLNLAHPGRGTVAWEAIAFPDGQQNVIIRSSRVSEEIKILSRLRDFRDLELVLCATASLREMGARRIHLFAPYFCGSRSDRKFVVGGNNYLRDVICPLVNASSFETVTTLDPHSDVLEACLRGFRKLDNHEIIKKAIATAGTEVVLVAPDAGAIKKTWAAATALGIADIVVAEKVRELSTGKILRTEIHGMGCEVDGKTFMIVDDICDGGRTFTALATAIRSGFAPNRVPPAIHLVVTHGIFSAGLSPFNNLIDRIHTTNSFRDIPGSGSWAEENSDLLGMMEVETVI
jgi:ribose-phosphate pyrophosphokinase